MSSYSWILVGKYIDKCLTLLTQNDIQIQCILFLISYVYVTYVIKNHNNVLKNR